MSDRAPIQQPGRRPLDLDHLDPNRSDGTGGHTADTNLQCLCRFHHRAKHQLPWHVTMHHDNGAITWHNRQTGITKTTYPDSH